MKKLMLAVAAVLMFGTMASAKIIGKVSDSKCGAAKHDAACVKKCVDAGEKYVVVSKGKVYQVDNQDKFADFAGKTVVVDGKVTGDSIAVTSVKEAGMMKKSTSKM